MQVACSAGNLTIYDGPDTRGKESNFCGRNKPGLIVSSDSTLYVVYTSNRNNTNFRGTWEKFESM